MVQKNRNSNYIHNPEKKKHTHTEYITIQYFHYEYLVYI